MRANKGALVRNTEREYFFFFTQGITNIWQMPEPHLSWNWNSDLRELTQGFILMHWLELKNEVRYFVFLTEIKSDLADWFDRGPCFAN